MAETLKVVFDDMTKHLRFDKKLADRIHMFERRFVNRNEDHIAFFSGYLTGVHRVIFTETDRREFFDDILDIDEKELRKRIINTPDINQNWKVTSDPYNLMCMYLLHRFSDSPIAVKDKVTAMEDVLLIFYYRIITSKLQNNFPHLVNKESAEAVYAQLSKKFALKRYGSWSAMIRARVADIIAPGALHTKTIKDFGPDKQVMYLVSDSQGRIRDAIDLQHDMLTTVRGNDQRIITTTSKIDIDGEEVLKDLTRNVNTYIHYLQSVVSDPASFIKDDIMKSIVAALPTIYPILLRDTLKHISDNYLLDKGNKIEKLLNKTLLHAIDILHEEYEGNIRNFHLPTIMIKLRNIYQSSRSTDANLMELRELSDELIVKVIGKRSDNIRASVRTGLLLYVVVRTLTKQHYAA